MAKRKSSIRTYKDKIKPDSKGRVPGHDSLTYRKMRGNPDQRGFTPLDCIKANLDKEIIKKRD